MMKGRTATTADIVRAANRLTAGWIKRLDLDNGSVASGPGVWTALAVLLSGADGRASHELAAATGLTRDGAAEGFNTIGELVEASPGLTLAAGLWTRPDVKLRDEFRDALKAVDVATIPSDHSQLDDWVDRATGGQIKRFPVAVTKEMRLILATALAVDVTWTEPFTGSPADKWRQSRTRQHYAWLTRQTTDLTQVSTATADQTTISRVVCATTTGLDVHLVAGSPEDSPAAVLTAAMAAVDGSAEITPAGELSDDRASGCLTVGFGPSTSGQPTLAVGVPAFTLNAKHNLLENSDLFGLTAALDDRRGHFQSMAHEPLAVDQAVQSATASFSAVGFRAAAVTVVAARAGAARVDNARQIRVDHDRPFGFLVVDRPSNLVMFAGWVAAMDDLDPISGPTSPRA